MLPRIIIASLPYALILPTVCSAYSCFFPDGGTASNYTACSSNNDGNCCLEGDFCTQWGYCISNTQGYHYRGACTDSTWGNPSCPDYCLAGTNSGNQSSVNVIACDAAASGGTWCCAYDGNCCNSTSTFKNNFGTIFAEGASPSTSASASASPTNTATTSSTPTAALTVATASSSISSASSPTKSDHKTAIIVGCVVGIPLGVSAIAALVLLVAERNKRKKLEINSTNMHWNSSQPSGKMESMSPTTVWSQYPQSQTSSQVQTPVEGHVPHHELASVQRRHELLGQARPQELGSS